MKRLLLFLAIFSSIYSYAQCNGRYEKPIFTQELTASFKYGENYKYDSTLQELYLDIYTPPQTDVVKERPCVVLCFGGAFVIGTRKSPEIAYIASQFARAGYVAACIDYRLDEQNHMSMSSNNEVKAVIRAIQDAKGAIRYLKEKREDFGIDTTQFFIGGTSAGGVMALSIAFSQYDEFTPDVKKIVDSLGGYEGNTNSYVHSTEVQGVFNFSGGMYDTSHIKDEKIPVYLNQGTRDQIMPFYSGYPLNGQSSILLYGSGAIYQRLKNLGKDVLLDSFNMSDHPVFTSSQGLGILVNTGSIMLKYFYKHLKCNNQSSSIEDENNLNISISPNPFTDKITIESSEPIKEKEVKIFDFIGREFSLETEKINWHSLEIKTSSLPKGLYLLKVNESTYKLIKE